MKNYKIQTIIDIDIKAENIFKAIDLIKELLTDTGFFEKGGSLGDTKIKELEK